MADPRELVSQLLQPRGRVIMVSGGSSGIGAAIVWRLIEEGYSVSVGVRQPDKAAVKFASTSVPPLVCRYDAAEPQSAAAWVDATIDRFGRLDALINNAGMTKPLSFAEGEESVLDELWAVNVKGPFRMIRLTLPHLAKSGHGRIINVASTDAKRYRDSTVSIAYAATKHALLSVSHAARFAGWNDGIRVTALSPGATDTDLVAGIPGVTPVGERVAPTTIAEAAAFLLRMPNNASVAELIVNSRLEPTI